MSRYESDKLPAGPIIFLLSSAVLFLGAIGIFIWLIVEAAEEHMVRNILFGSSFLTITVGLFIYSLLVYRRPKASTAIVYAEVILGIAAFIVGLCL